MKRSRIDFIGQVVVPGVMLTAGFDLAHRIVAASGLHTFDSPLLYDIVLLAGFTPVLLFSGYIFALKPAWIVVATLWPWFVLSVGVCGLVHLCGFDDPFFRMPPVIINLWWERVVGALSIYLACWIIQRVMGHYDPPSAESPAGRNTANASR